MARPRRSAPDPVRPAASDPDVVEPDGIGTLRRPAPPSGGPRNGPAVTPSRRVSWREDLLPGSRRVGVLSRQPR
jgi:hypothetical protein